MPETSDVQRGFYNRAYPRRDRLPGPHSGLPALLRPFELHRIDAVLRHLPRGGVLLDVGCGDGELLARAAPDFARVVGVEVADTQVAGARERLARDGLTHAAVLQANVDRGLPLRDEQFDAVTLVAVLGLVFDPLAVLTEVRRVLRRGGWLVLEVLNLAYLPRRLAVLSGHLPPYTACHGWEGGHLHNFTRPAVVQLLHEQGFDVQHVTGSGVLAPYRGWSPAGLLGNVIAFSTRR